MYVHGSNSWMWWCQVDDIARYQTWLLPSPYRLRSDGHDTDDNEPKCLEHNSHPKCNEISVKGKESLNRAWFRSEVEMPSGVVPGQWTMNIVFFLALFMQRGTCICVYIIPTCANSPKAIQTRISESKMLSGWPTAPIAHIPLLMLQAKVPTSFIWATSEVAYPLDSQGSIQAIVLCVMTWIYRMVVDRDRFSRKAGQSYYLAGEHNITLARDILRIRSSVWSISQRPMDLRRTTN